jgi:hypothetical protein
MSDVEIEIGPSAYDGKVIVDGHDIAKAVRSIRIDAEVGYQTTVRLGLAVADVTKLSSAHAEVLIADSAAEYLERAGWTPPPGVPSVLPRRDDGCPCEWKDVSGPGTDPDEPELILGRVVPTCPVHGQRNSR